MGKVGTGLLGYRLGWQDLLGMCSSTGEGKCSFTLPLLDCTRLEGLVSEEVSLGKLAWIGLTSIGGTHGMFCCEVL